MGEIRRTGRRRALLLAAVVAAVNLLTLLALRGQVTAAADGLLRSHAEETQVRFNTVMEHYKRSFQVFALMMSREIEHSPDPDDLWDYLKRVDAPLLAIEGDTFDGLYMYYRDRYLYSWDTPYEQYEKTGYQATQRPWYKAALAGKGQVVFTPPYMSYANHYILSTISQLQPDGETVFAYDIKMGDIQALVSSLNALPGAQIMIFDERGTVIGSTRPDYLGGNFYDSLEEAAGRAADARARLDGAGALGREAQDKLREELESASAFYAFRQEFDHGFAALREAREGAVRVKLGDSRPFGYLRRGDGFSFLILAPTGAVLMATLGVWLIPLAGVELALLYLLGRTGKERKNRALRAAYVELGQTQRRLELALNAAQKAAAIDELTGMMNFRSFRKAVTERLEEMGEEDSGILIMLDGDYFKRINDSYGHSVGDEVIKLCAQMIVGRIRTVDLASRLHGDEFAIFIANSGDCAVAGRIIEDINHTISQEAIKRNMPAITLSAGAVTARRGDAYPVLYKAADAALYRAKETHNGGFSC